MRILQVISSLRVGGAETIVKDLTLGLISRGFEVDIAIFDGADSPIKRELVQRGCIIHSFSKNGRVYSLSNIIKLARLINSYDIVHAHNTAPQLYLAICSIFIRSVFITTEHSTFNRRRNWFFYRPIDRWMYMRYDKIVCVSDQVYDNLKSYLGERRVGHNVLTIHNGVDVISYYQSEGYDRQTFLPHSMGKFVVSMVAGFRKEKDHDTLIKAFALLPNDSYELWLIGDGIRRAELESLVDSLDIQDRVFFLGDTKRYPTAITYVRCYCYVFSL